jgi:hypothetical protein
LDLPDPDDCHVLAAAIRGNAQAIVTFNLRDFPDHVLERYDIETKHPDEFILDTIGRRNPSIGFEAPRLATDSFRQLSSFRFTWIRTQPVQLF